MNRNECGSGREGTWEIESKHGGGEGNVRDLGSRTTGRFGSVQYGCMWKGHMQVYV